MSGGGAKSQKGGIGIMQDLPQIGAFRIPAHVALTELMEMKVTLKMDCVWLLRSPLWRHCSKIEQQYGKLCSTTLHYGRVGENGIY